MSEYISTGPESFWVQTRSGRAVDLLDTKPEQIFAEDLAVQLARIPRWNGATLGRPDEVFPVAAHSVLVANLMPPDASPALRLFALLHDADEAYTGDIPSPLKWAMRHILQRNGCTINPLRHIADTIQRAVLDAVGLFGPVPHRWHDAVKAADLLAMALEDKYLMALHPRLWISLPDVARVALQPMTCSPKTAALSFMFSLQRYVRDAGVTPMPEFGLEMI